jgi:hypothetical protein
VCTALPEPTCGAGSRWTSGTSAFRDATADWKLTGAEGVRINVTDLDSDGWPDLVVRHAGVGSDDFAGTRRTWLLRNTGEKSFEDVTQSSGFLAMRTTRAALGVAWRGDVRRRRQRRGSGWLHRAHHQ